MEYLNPTSINGLNLYCYCNNNPIMYVDPSGHIGLLISAMITLLGVAITLGLISIEDGISEISVPEFKPFNSQKIDGSGFQISGGGYLIKKSWYLDKFKSQSFYISFGNESIDSAFNPNKFDIKDVLQINFNLVEIGYDGKYIDLSISAGIDTEFVSIDIGAIIKDINNYFKQKF